MPFRVAANRKNRVWVVLSESESIPRCSELIFSFLKKSIFCHVFVQKSVHGGPEEVGGVGSCAKAGKCPGTGLDEQEPCQMGTGGVLPPKKNDSRWFQVSLSRFRVVLNLFLHF